jgi:hypothetical protein
MKKLSLAILSSLMAATALAGDMSGNTAYFSSKAEIVVLPSMGGSASGSLMSRSASISGGYGNNETILGANINSTGGSSSNNNATFINSAKITVTGSLIAGANVNR